MTPAVERIIVAAAVGSAALYLVWRSWRVWRVAAAARAAAKCGTDCGCG